MASSENVKCFFPLRNIKDVIVLFQSEIQNSDEPNLALLSIIVGYIENMLTCSRSLPLSEEPAETEYMFPTVESSEIDALYAKFKCQIKGSVDLSQYKSSRYATRELVKKVSDVVWGHLTRSYYKDRAHLQSLYSYLTGNKLDCFGVAFAVVAAFQVLGYKDVHLALSEDHAWVTYGINSEETAEVTWHGKGNEDKRGQPVNTGVTEKSWLYLNNQPVKCTRHTEVAALVSGINPSINGASDSIELARMQQQLLWLLHDLNHISIYPMALGNLGDLEEICSTPGRPPPIDLFRESILAAQSLYNNMHVYPYTYLGGYLYRNGRYKGALEAWANASGVIKQFNYGREDEEIYKEFLEIANELIPHIVKVVSSSSYESPFHGADIPLLQDAECFAHLLRFYDGLCEWEEGSATPVLHIGWAKPLVSTISKFPGKVRSMVHIIKSERSNEEDDTRKEKDKSSGSTINGSENAGKQTIKSKSSCSEKQKGKTSNSIERDAVKPETSKTDSTEEPHPNILALAAQCTENILNPKYLLGSGEPFSYRLASSSTVLDSKDMKPNGTAVVPNLCIKKELAADLKATLLSKDDLLTDSPTITLYSEKMKGLKDLLLAEKLNTSAIQLQLTAQSQVLVVKRSRVGEVDVAAVAGCRSTKRRRRE